MGFFFSFQNDPKNVKQSVLCKFRKINLEFWGCVGVLKPCLIAKLIQYICLHSSLKKGCSGEGINYIESYSSYSDLIFMETACFVGIGELFNAVNFSAYYLRLDKLKSYHSS